jgi:thiamine-phosphate diphosphorylase
VIPRLHLVTDDEILGRPDFLSWAEGVLDVGGEDLALHLRGPGTGGRRLFELAEALRRPAARAGGTLLINDRLDIAMVLHLDGAHLGQRSLPAEVARRLLGRDALLGLSVHSELEARVGERVGEVGGEAFPSAAGPPPPLDYLVVGSIFPTPSHPERNPGGLGRIGEVRAVSDLPILAIGGITPDRVGLVLATGAHGVAVRGGIWDAEDPTEATRVYVGEVRKG